MKQVIVMMAMILLGVFIFQLVAGPEEDSLKNVSGRIWQQELEVRTTWP